MILYNPLDGNALTIPIQSNPRHCFLMTRLGTSIPDEVKEMRAELTRICNSEQYKIIDANIEITGRDFLLKIWKLIAATPVSIGISHEELPIKTQLNIYYELGVAQALGKETIIVKSSKSEIPSDFVRSEYITYDENFQENFLKYLKAVHAQAELYEVIAEQLEKNPVLAIDYLRRAFLITGNRKLKKKAQKILNTSGLHERAQNSVELLVANF